MRRILLLVLVLVAAGVGIVVWKATRGSSPVSESTAVGRYRAGGAQPGSGPPAPGVYTYAASGWECGGVGPLCLRRSLPKELRLVVSWRARQLTLERDYSTEHVEAQRFAVGPKGRHLTWQRQDISIVGIGRDERDTPVPQPLVQPAKLHVGASWRARFHLRKVVADSRSRVVSARTATVGGRSLKVFEIATTTTSTGPFHGTETVRELYAPSLGLDVWRKVERRISGEFAYRLSVEERLQSTAPAR